MLTYMKKQNLSRYYSLVILLTIAQFFFAATNNSLTKVIVSPSHKDWHYELKDKASFEVRVFLDNIMVEDIPVKYIISEDLMSARKEGTAILKKGVAKIEAGTMNKPGFLRCEVVVEIDGNTHKGMATAAFAPEQIKPTTTEPNDFMQFWNKAIESAKRIPLDSQMTLIPEECTSTVDVYHVRFQNNKKGSYIYGMLAMPKAEGKYPVLLSVPGAGVYKYNAPVDIANQGFIALSIGIHGIPVNLDRQVYSDLANGALNGYSKFGINNKDEYYYKRVFTGCLRAVDFLCSLPQYDGKNFFVRGGSQGGALSIVTAALDKRVKAIAAYYPGMSDLTGWLHDRAGAKTIFKSKEEITPKEAENSRYYDTVNFARHLSVPVFYAFGYNDLQCAPTVVHSVYNTINSSKELLLIKELGHKHVPELSQKSMKWIKQQIEK